MTAERPGVDAARIESARARLAPIASEYPFEPRFVSSYTAAGKNVVQHYVDEGPRDGEPLLFVHGNPTWSFAWRGAIRALSSEYRCVAVDHVGCGLSDKPQDYAYRLENHVDNLERIALALDLTNVTLVLHDWGGAIGMGFARRHPERVARIVVMNTAAFRSGRIPLRIAACRIPGLGRFAVQGMNAFARAATFMAVERPLAPLVKRGYLLPYDSWEARVATLAFVEDIPMDPSHPSWRELVRIENGLGRFADRPVSILWGERDWCFTPAFREEWERRFPNATVERFEGAGHYLFEDAFERLPTQIHAFLRSNPLR